MAITSPEKRHKLGKSAARVFEAIKDSWPTNPLDIARSLGEHTDGNEKTLSSRYLYHFRKLERLGLIGVKKLGNTYVAWPADIEKLRAFLDKNFPELRER